MKKKSNKLGRIITTHFPKGGKSSFIGQAALVNGQRAIAYVNVNNNRLESYIPMEEINSKMYGGDIPQYDVNF